MERIDLTPIFYSNYSAGIDYYLLDEIMLLIDKHCLNYQREIISNLEAFYDFIDKINNKDIKTFDIEGGGNRHLALKLIGLKHYGNGVSQIRVESWFNGYIPDLLFKNQSGMVTIVECGDTNPVKITEYFARREVEKIVIISYPEEGDDSIYQHVFIKKGGFDNYLKMKQEINFEKIRKIINRR